MNDDAVARSAIHRLKSGTPHPSTSIGEYIHTVPLPDWVICSDHLGGFCLDRIVAVLRFG